MKFQIKYLILISILFFSQSCSSFYNSLKLVSEKKFENIEIHPVLPASFNLAVFKIEFDIAGKYFSGILFIRRADKSIFKNTIINNAGINIISFEFNNRNFSLISCIEELKNKYVIKTFEYDFRNIFYLPESGAEVDLLKNQKRSNIYLVKGSDNNLYYFVNKNQNITQLDLVHLNKKTVRYIFSYNNNSTIDSVKIIHYNFPLTINFSLSKLE